MNIYDFDKTIYDGDSTLDFYFYSLKKNPIIFFKIFKAIIYLLKYKMKLTSKEKFKETFYEFFLNIPNIEKEVESFWDSNISKIKAWYLEQMQTSDIIISASPEFLLKPAIKRIGLKEENLIASKVSPKTGRYTGKNCYGEEKIYRLKKHMKKIGKENETIENAYSDSLSDKPILTLAKKGYIVTKDEIFLKYE